MNRCLDEPFKCSSPQIVDSQILRPSFLCANIAFLTRKTLRALATAVLVAGLASTALAGQTAAALANAAWAAIRDGRHADAASAFADALRRVPGDPTLHFGA